MQTKKNIKEEEEESLLQQLASKYIPYWSWFLLAFIIAIGGAFTYMKFATPLYEAKAAILIKDETKGNEESKMAASLNLISSNVIVENEVEVLQSYSLMKKVVKALDLYAPVFQEGKLHPVSAYSNSPVVIEVPSPDSIKEFNNRDSIKKYNKIYFSFDGNAQTVVLGDKYKYPVNEIVTTPYGSLKFIPNKDYQNSEKADKKFYFALQNPASVASNLSGSLKVESAGKLSSIINLSYKDAVPQRATDVLDQLITAYRQSEINEKDTLAKNTLVFVESRLRLASNDLDSIEKKIQEFKSGKGAVDISTQGQLYLQNVSANDQKLSEVNTQISELDQVEKFVKNNEYGGAIVPFSVSVGVANPVLSQLIDQLYTTELQYEKLKKTVGENNPSLVAIQDQINKIKPNILQNIQSQKQSLIAARGNIYATNGSYNSILQGVPQKERQLLDISREQQIKSNIYAFLLQKREESALAYASTVSSNRVVDEAHTLPDPVSPKKMVVYLIALVACLGFTVAVISMKESLLGKVQYRGEVESRTTIPIIAEIDFDKSKTAVVITPGKRSFLSEQFRKLRISLSFLGIDDRHKKILVVSSIPGEGKSFIAANLAISIAHTGKKVVLMDLDLNNPSLSTILNANHEHGVTEFLSGEKEPGEIINRITGHENLFFISAATLPEDPSELLSTEKAKELLDYLENIFDVVLIDTSPVGLVNDGYILTGLCDATLYVVRQNYTPKALIKKIDENNRINPITNPAIVFNGVKTRGFLRNYYGYGYKYGYGNKKKRKGKKIVREAMS
ncbi:MAG TPA: polysaccharide biosynthesis tyrosine autokinase [Hanamia sp.]